MQALLEVQQRTILPGNSLAVRGDIKNVVKILHQCAVLE
jgi:hypothetical protein